MDFNPMMIAQGLRGMMGSSGADGSWPGGASGSWGAAGDQGGPMAVPGQQPVAPQQNFAQRMGQNILALKGMGRMAQNPSSPMPGQVPGGGQQMDPQMAQAGYTPGPGGQAMDPQRASQMAQAQQMAMLLRQQTGQFPQPTGPNPPLGGQ